MKKKLHIKSLILGFTIGMLTFTIASPSLIKAAIEEYVLTKAEYPLVLQGEEYDDSKHPMLNYDGNTYCNVRSVLETAGFDVNWDNDNKVASATLTTTDNVDVTPKEPEQPTEEDLNSSPDIQEPTDDESESSSEEEVVNYETTTLEGMNAIVYNDEYYLDAMDVHNNIKEHDLVLMKYNNELSYLTKVVFLTEIPTLYINNTRYVAYDTYLEKIVPEIPNFNPVDYIKTPDGLIALKKEGGYYIKFNEILFSVLSNYRKQGYSIMQSADFKSFTITQDGKFVAEFDLVSIDDISYVPYDVYVDEIVKVFK